MTTGTSRPLMCLATALLVYLLVPGAAPAGSVRPDGSVSVYRPPPASSAQNPAFSPDGAHLLFTRFRRGYNRGPAGLFTVPTGGGHAARLLFEPGFDSVNLPGSAWNAATGRIAFSSDRGEGPDEIWTVRTDGGGLRRVTRHASRARFMEPSFSPDGGSIVFEVDPARSDAGPSIWRVPAGGSPKRLTGPSSRLSDREPNWSPLGDRIIFQRRAGRRGDWDLWSMAPDGSSQRRVTSDPGDDTDPSFSPDGRWVVYSSDRDGLRAANLFVVPAAGGLPVRITHDARYSGAPSWSPDGEWIAYESSMRRGDELPTAIWRIRAPVATGA